MAKTGQFGIGLIAGIGGGGSGVTIAPVNQTPSALDITGASGSTSATWRSMTFVVNQGTCVIDGVTYQEGTYGFSNDTFGTLSSINYDASGSTDCSILIQL